MKISKFLFCLCFTGSILSASDPVEGLPWFTGPLLTPSPNVIPKGHVNFEPYFVYSDTNGFYDNDGNRQSQVSLIQWYEQFPLQLGIADNLEFDIIPSVYTNKKSGKTSSNFADTGVGLFYQVYSSDNLYPSIKMGVRVTFPTGKYTDADPKKAGIDITGGGAFLTTLTFCIGKAYHIYDDHWLNFRTFLSYTYGFQTHVEGFNAYGGGFGCYGEVYPGNLFVWLTGFEYSLTRNWALAFDVSFFQQNKIRFSGNPGTYLPVTPELPNPPVANIGAPSGWQLSLAPAIEYNFNEHWGVIAGPWFTVAGKNTNAFITGMLAINIYY